jgi:hypothetical protein
MPGHQFVILGSGDIGMIMARRLTFEGAKVERVLEILPYLNGLTRNYVQCLQDFDIPLQLCHTVSRIIGHNRVEEVETVQVDERWQPVPGTKEIIPCDTLLLSVGLIPENEISLKAGVELNPVTGGPSVDDGYATSVPGIFGAGNVVHVYDLVDWVTEAGFQAGRSAARFVSTGTWSIADTIRVQAGENVRYVVPQTLRRESIAERDIKLQMRVRHPMEHKVSVQVLDGDDVIASKSLRYARPGEMVSVKLSSGRDGDAVRSARALTIRVVGR